MINRDNYLMTKEFLAYYAEVLLKDSETINRKRLWLRHLLRWADDVPFQKAPGIRPVFPLYLATAGRAESSGKALQPIGLKRGCQETRQFFSWLRGTYPRAYPQITPAWIDTIQPPTSPEEPPKEHKAATLEVVRKLIAVKVEPGDLKLMRDKATAALLFLSGARASALCTLALEHVHIAERTIEQDASKGVRTKGKKSGITYLLEIPDLLAVVSEWDTFVRERLPPTAPWYPVIDISLGEQRLVADKPGQFRANGLAKNIRALFEKAGLPPMSPHKFRHGHALHGLELAKDMADLKAVSMNLMHSSIGITDTIYAVLDNKGTQKRISQLGQGAVNSNADIEQLKASLLDMAARLEKLASTP